MNKRDKKNTSRIIIDKIEMMGVSNESSSVVYSDGQEQQQQLDKDYKDDDQDREHNDEFDQIDQETCKEEENGNQLEDDSNQPSCDEDEEVQCNWSESRSNYDVDEFEELDGEKLVAVKVTQTPSGDTNIYFRQKGQIMRKRIRPRKAGPVGRPRKTNLEEQFVQEPHLDEPDKCLPQLGELDEQKAILVQQNESSSSRHYQKNMSISPSQARSSGSIKKVCSAVSGYSSRAGSSKSLQQQNHKKRARSLSRMMVVYTSNIDDVVAYFKCIKRKPQQQQLSSAEAAADDISSSSGHLQSRTNKRRRIRQTPISSPNIQGRPLVSFVDDVNIGQENDDDEKQRLLIRRSTRPLSTRPVNYFPDYENGSLLTDETTSESRHKKLKTMSQHVDDEASRTEAKASALLLPEGKRANGEPVEQQQQKQLVKPVKSTDMSKPSPPKLSEASCESEDHVKQEPSVSVVANGKVEKRSKTASMLTDTSSPSSASSTSAEFEHARQLVEERLKVMRVKQAKAMAEIKKVQEEMKKLEEQRQSCATELAESRQLTKAQLSRLKVQIDNIQAEMKRYREEYDQKKANLEKKMNLYGNQVETLAKELDDAKKTFESGQECCIAMELIVENYHKIV